jgi:hypothetical protein
MKCSKLFQEDIYREDIFWVFGHTDKNIDLEYSLQHSKLVSIGTCMLVHSNKIRKDMAQIFGKCIHKKNYLLGFT